MPPRRGVSSQWQHRVLLPFRAEVQALILLFSEAVLEQLASRSSYDNYLIDLNLNQPLWLWFWKNSHLWQLMVSQSSTGSGWCWQFLLITAADTCKQVHYYLGNTAIYKPDVIPPDHTLRGRGAERVIVPRGCDNFKNQLTSTCRGEMDLSYSNSCLL